MNTPTQLGLDGMALADAAASMSWTERWDAAIAELARRGRPFTADDVRGLAGPPEDHANAAGARFNAAARSGLILRVGFRRSERASLHSHHIAEWSGTAKARGVA